MIAELVSALAITSLFTVSVLLALVTFEEAESTQETEMGVLAQLRYQTEIIRGLPLGVIQQMFASNPIISRTGVNDQKLYGILNPPGRIAVVNWQLVQADVNPDTGEELLGVIATVSASVTTNGGITITKQATVYRALE